MVPVSPIQEQTQVTKVTPPEVTKHSGEEESTERQPQPRTLFTAFQAEKKHGKNYLKISPVIVLHCLINISSTVLFILYLQLLITD